MTRPQSQFNAEQSNQMARHHLSPLILLLAMIMKDIKQKTWILFCPKSQHPRRMLVPQLTRPRSQFNAEQSNQMARHHPPTFSVNTHEGCWYHSWQDHDTSLCTQINDIKSGSCLTSLRRIIMNQATQVKQQLTNEEREIRKSMRKAGWVFSIHMGWYIFLQKK